MIEFYLKKMVFAKGIRTVVILLFGAMCLFIIKEIQNSKVNFQDIQENIELRINQNQLIVMKDEASDSVIEKEKKKHYQEFQQAVDSKLKKISTRDLSGYLDYSIAAAKFGYHLYDEFPELYGYGSYLMEEYSLKLSDVLKFANKNFVQDKLYHSYLRGKQQNISFEDVFKDTILDKMGSEEFISMFYSIVYCIPIVLLFFGFERKNENNLLENLPITSYRKTFDNVFVILLLGCVCQVMIIIVYFLLLSIFGVVLFDVHIPYMIGEHDLTIKNILIYFSYFLLLIDISIVLLGIVLKKLRLNSLLIQLILLFSVFFEGITQKIMGIKYFAMLDFLYYIDFLPAINGNKSFLYHHDFWIEKGIQEWMLVTIVLIGILMIILLFQERSRRI